MLLQELFTEKYKDSKDAYGIEMNDESSKIEFHTPPEHFEAFGFILRLDEDGLIKDDLLDIIINYKITNVDVMIEVPSQLLLSKKVEAKYLLQLASNVDFMISILPPGHKLVGDTVTDAEYADIIEDFTKELIIKPNFDKFICPISSFMEYLMLETLLGKENLAIKNFKPEDQYIIENFSSILSVESSDLFKARIRQVVYDFYEGEENFKVVASLMFKSIEAKSEEIFTNYTKEYINQNQKNE